MEYAQYVVAGLTTASIYSLVSLGLTMMYGVARVLNVANAMMFGLAAFAALELVNRGVPFVLAALLAVAAVLVLGLATYLLFFRRQLERPFSALVISLGLVVVMQAVMIAVWGLDINRIPTPLSGTVTIGSLTVVKGAIVTIVVAAALTTALFVVLRQTALGRAMRAVQEDPETAQLLGIRTQTVIISVFLIGTALAAIGGVLVGTFIPFTGDSATSYSIKAFVIAIVGGLGRPVGAVVASLLVATAETVPAAIGLASWSPAFLYGSLVLILLFRPKGLFGTFGHDHGASMGEEDPGAIAGDEHDTRRGRPWVVIAAVAGTVVVFNLLAPSIFHDAALRGTGAHAVALVLLAYAVWMPLHFIGVASIGHVAIWGAAAYATVIGTQEWEIGLLPRFVVAMVVGVVLAAAVASVTMRVRGLVSAAAVTLGLAGLIVNVLGNLEVTGGTTGLTFVAPLELFGVEYSPQDTDIMVYSIGSVLIGAVIVAMWLLQRSRVGRRMLAVRDAETLAASLGMSTYRVKVAGFAASGVVVGAASVLYVHYNRYIDPSLFHDTVAINVLLAVIVGGSTYLMGPLVGALLLAFLPELLPFDGVMNRAVYGMVVVLIATFANDGLMGWFRQAVATARGRWRGPGLRVDDSEKEGAPA